MKKKKFLIIGIILSIISLIGYFLLDYYNLVPKEYYTAKDFGISTVLSAVDYNNNGVDDYTDIMLGARIDALNHPAYDGSYVVGGYPKDNIGVCTDVIWRAFKNAGYSLKDMVDKDIEVFPEDYPSIKKKDNNIDFRRVRNLLVFFEKYAISLTTDTSKIEEFQPGDIVIFDDTKHIGIVSDKRNKEGKVYIIHNGGQMNREEDYLKRGNLTGHFRFDTALLDETILSPWTN